MKNIVIIVAFLFFSINSNAQENKLKSVYFEIGGRSIYGSLNYEQTIKTFKNGYLTGRIGLSLIPLNRFFNTAIPISSNYVFGLKNHHLELGFGATFHHLQTKSESSVIVGNETTYRDIKDVYRWVYLSPSFGYRYQKATSGFYFSSQLIAFIGIYNKTNGNNIRQNNQPDWLIYPAFFPLPVMPWLGISIGYSFN